MALPDAFEAYVLALYRHWYGLPRWSSRIPLEDMRATLADDLRSGPGDAGPDQIDAMLAFVVQSGKLPGADEAVAPVLANRNHGVMLGGQLRPSTIPQAAILPLIALLEEEHPTRHAVALQSYIPGREAATLQAVRDRLSQGRDRFPDATQTFLADLFARADAGDLATVDALLALEQSDDVLRVAWREILAGKSDKILRNLGLARAAAPDPTPSAAPAPDSPNGAGVSTHYFTDVRFPARVKVHERYPLLVRLTLNQEPESVSTDQVPVEFEDPDEPEFLEVVLTAAGFDDAFAEPGSKPRRTMIVRHQQDSEPVVFWIRADEVGTKQISIDFYREGKCLGGTRFTTEVATIVSSTTTQVKMTPDETEMELRFSNLPQPADLELRVTYDRGNRQLAYMLHSTKGDAVFHFSDMGVKTLLEEDASKFFADSFQFMDRIAAYNPEILRPEEVADFQRQINNLGRKLFEQLLSPQLQEAYWRIKKLREEGIVRSLLITTDEPWIPWELIRPYSYDDFTDEERQDDFWGVTFQISRWLNGPGPFEQINVDAVSLIVPQTDLMHTETEGASFAQMRARGVQIGEPLKTKTDVMQAITAGNTRLLHFATHASFKSDAPDQSPVVLNGGSLVPADLDPDTIRALRRQRPIVFLNACRSGRIAFQLTGMDGWAERMVKKLRATAFIGTLWEVHDKLAAEFSAVFYRELLAGKTLGESFQTARLHIRDAAPANPTWLAYTLYGDPNTRVMWGERQD